MQLGNIESISTREDFINFLHDFRADLEAKEAYWQNPSLDMFLEAMAWWMENCMDDYFKRNQEEVPQPSWRLFAELMHVGAVYE